MRRHLLAAVTATLALAVSASPTAAVQPALAAPPALAAAQPAAAQPAAAQPAAAQPAAAQPAAAPRRAGVPLPVVTSTVTVDLDGRRFSARLVRPRTPASTALGEGAAYPAVAFGHGMLQRSSRYASTLAAIAARGYVVIAPDSELTALGRQAVLADDLWRALRWVRSSVPDAHPTLDAVIGHSLGGGAALIAADRRPTVETAIALAPAQLSPAAAISSRGITEPALYVAASLDLFVSPLQVKTQYLLKRRPAMYASIRGGFHCGFNDTVILLGIGCDRGSISRATQLTITHGLVTGWLDEQLRGRAWTLPAGVSVSTK